MLIIIHRTNKVPILDKVYTSDIINNDTWYKQYKICWRYYNINNMFPMSADIYENYKIGLWYYTLRNTYHLKTKDEKFYIYNKMNIISPIWMIVPYRMIKLSDDDIWFPNFIILRKFYRKYKRMPYIDDKMNNINDGNWVNIQIKNYDNITLQNKYILFCFNSYWYMPIIDCWYLYYKAIKSYIDNIGGSIDKYLVYNNMRIGIWYFDQLYRIKNNYMSNMEKLYFKKLQLDNNKSVIEISSSDSSDETSETPVDSSK